MENKSKQASSAKQLAELLASYQTLPAFVGIADLGVNTRGNFGEFPLHVAAALDDTAAITLLLDAGASIDQQGEHGYTALHEAVEQGNQQAAALLHARGARCDLQNAFGLNAKELAATLGVQAIIKIFTAD